VPARAWGFKSPLRHGFVRSSPSVTTTRALGHSVPAAAFPSTCVATLKSLMSSCERGVNDGDVAAASAPSTSVCRSRPTPFRTGRRAHSRPMTTGPHRPRSQAESQSALPCRAKTQNRLRPRTTPDVAGRARRTLASDVLERAVATPTRNRRTHPASEHRVRGRSAPDPRASSTSHR